MERNKGACTHEATVIRLLKNEKTTFLPSVKIVRKEKNLYWSKRDDRQTICLSYSNIDFFLLDNCYRRWKHQKATTHNFPKVGTTGILSDVNLISIFFLQFTLSMLLSYFDVFRYIRLFLAKSSFLRKEIIMREETVKVT